MTTARQYSFHSPGTEHRQDLAESRAEIERAVQALRVGLAGVGARRGRIWALGVIDPVGSLTGAFERHARSSKQALVELAEIAPELDHVMIRLEEEHAEIILALEECLCRLRREPSAPETEWVNDMRTDLIHTLRALADHQEREECFVHDTVEFETGGGD